MSAESRWAAVAALGQSVWYDNVARPALAGGHLARLVDHDRVSGGTSNPSIFAKAVLDSDVYDDELGAAPASDSDAEVFERCWIEDIRRAATSSARFGSAPAAATVTSRSRRRPISPSRSSRPWGARTSSARWSTART